jgi:hypothetical protein
MISKATLFDHLFVLAYFVILSAFIFLAWAQRGFYAFFTGSFLCFYLPYTVCVRGYLREFLELPQVDPIKRSNGSQLLFHCTARYSSHDAPWLSSFVPSSYTTLPEDAALLLENAPPISLKDYWIRRCTQVAPAYSAVFALLCAVAPTTLTLVYALAHYYGCSELSWLIIFLSMLLGMLPIATSAKRVTGFHRPGKDPPISVSVICFFSVLLQPVFLGILGVGIPGPPQWCPLDGPEPTLFPILITTALSGLAYYLSYHAHFRAVRTESCIALVPRSAGMGSVSSSTETPIGTQFLLLSDATCALCLEKVLRQAASNGVMGVSIGALKKLQNVVKWRAMRSSGVIAADCSTKVVNDAILKPATEAWGSSFYDALQAAGSEGVELGTPRTGPLAWVLEEGDTGPASAFLSHAWSFSFKSMVDLLEQHSKRTQEQKMILSPAHFDLWHEGGLKKCALVPPLLMDVELCVWFDLVFKNQHEASSDGVAGSISAEEYSARTRAQFEHNIGGPGTTLAIMLGEGSEVWPPAPLKRAWCLFELITTLRLQERERGRLCLVNERATVYLSTDDLTKNNCSGPSAVIASLQAETEKFLGIDVHVENAEAFKEADREMVLNEICKMGGFGEINSKIKEGLLQEHHSVRVFQASQYFQEMVGRIAFTLALGTILLPISIFTASEEGTNVYAAVIPPIAFVLISAVIASSSFRLYLTASTLSKQIGRAIAKAKA